MTTKNYEKEIEKILERKMRAYKSEQFPNEKESLNYWVKKTTAQLLTLLNEAVAGERERIIGIWDDAVSIVYCEHCGKFMTQKQEEKLKRMKSKLTKK